MAVEALSILFVCTGNQCRSPVAAQLFQDEVKNLSTFIESSTIGHIDSVGVWATAGSRSPSRLIKAALNAGIDLRSHRARTIEQISNLASYDLILTMERTQCESLRVEFPAIADRIHLLTSLVGPAYDVSDPIGGTEEDYQFMIDDLRQLIARALPEIGKLAMQIPHA